MSHNRKAFTLIELLVVIAIIAILAAILFPVFAQAKKSAIRTQALSNTKQIVLSSLMYLGDNDDVYHQIRQCNGTTTCLDPAWRTANDPQWAIGAHHMLEPYVKNRQIFADPGNPIAPNDCDASHGGSIGFAWTHYRNPGNDPTGPNQVFGLHAYHHGTWSLTTRNTVGGSPSQSIVGSPASTINLYPMWFGGSVWEGYGYYRWYTIEIGGKDRLGVVGGLPEYPRGFSVAWCSGQPSTLMSLGSYDGQVNWGFADGHVKSLRRSAVMDISWDPTVGADNTGRKNLLHYDERFK